MKRSEMRKIRHGIGVFVIALLLGSPALAFHKQAPTVLQLTIAGDTDLPRIPAQGRRAMSLTRENGADTQAISLLPFKTGSHATILAPSGANTEPTASFSGRVFAWETDADPLLTGAPGVQVVLESKGDLLQPIVDPTGTSANPSLDKSGRIIVFESEGDLAGQGSTSRQIFLVDKNGFATQVSSGDGDSSKAMLSPKQRRITFESTSDSVSGADTGVTQIWAGVITDLPAKPITNGAGPSSNALLSDDGRLVTFQSTADLAGDGADTGVPQIFIWDTRSGTYAQITDDPSGCVRPAGAKIRRDWRITFVCAGNAYYFMLRENQRYQVLTPGGTTQAMAPEMGAHFVTLSTTADLLSGGTTTGHQIFMVNLFKQPAVPVPGSAVWFPEQGITGF
jgi:Tol biopolymer transport system component